MSTAQFRAQISPTNSTPTTSKPPIYTASSPFFVEPYLLPDHPKLQKAYFASFQHLHF